MEAEYADIFRPAFYASQAYWYVKGHFPCGWEVAFQAENLLSIDSESLEYDF